MTESRINEPLSPWEEFMAALAVGCFVGSIAAATLMNMAVILLLCLAPTNPWTWALVALVAALLLLPLGPKPGPFGRWFTAYCCKAGPRYFSLKVVTEEGATFHSDKSYIIGLEPHSALPSAMPAAFGIPGQVLPEGLQGRTYGLASSVCFQVPLVRHIYWWMGIRPITRVWIRKLLHRNKNLVLVPGGVQECLYMQKGCETAFLKKRKGFIRVAMQNGSAVVACFAFGQTDAFSWYRPGPPWMSDATVQALSRRIGAVPMLLMGRWGTPIPYRTPITLAFGKPIEVPHLDSPSEELLQEYLDKYISSMQQLFEKYKAEAGYPHMKLHVI